MLKTAAGNWKGEINKGKRLCKLYLILEYFATILYQTKHSEVNFLLKYYYTIVKKYGRLLFYDKSNVIFVKGINVYYQVKQNVHYNAMHKHQAAKR